jgi:hypothetical protein
MGEGETFPEVFVKKKRNSLTVLCGTLTQNAGRTMDIGSAGKI